METDIVRQSGILSWNEENINQTPPTPGVFVLRNSPINGSLRNLDRTNNLRETLVKIYQEQLVSDVNFFDWYEVSDLEKAEKLLKEFQIRYGVSS